MTKKALMSALKKMRGLIHGLKVLDGSKHEKNWLVGYLDGIIESLESITGPIL